MFDIDQKLAKLQLADNVVVYHLEPSTIRHADADVRVTHAKFIYSSPDNTIRDDVQRCVYATFGVSACMDPHSVKIGAHAITADILAPEFLTLPRRDYSYYSGITAAKRETPSILWAQPGDQIRAFHGIGLLEGEVLTLHEGQVVIRANGEVTTLPLQHVARITKACVQASIADPAFHCLAKHFPRVFSSLNK